MFKVALALSTLAVGYSQQCFDSSSCSRGFECVGRICLQSRRGSIAPVVNRCSSNNQCNSNEACVDSKCVVGGCTYSWDCNYNEACLGNTCQVMYAPDSTNYWCNSDWECAANEFCNGWHCELCRAGDGNCAGSRNFCTNSQQCETAEACVGGICQVKQCTFDNQCGFTEVCDPYLGHCVDCSASMINPFGGGSFFAAPANAIAGSCLGTGSAYWCYYDQQCPFGEVCEMNACRSTGPLQPNWCQNDAACGVGKRCEEGLCVNSFVSSQSINQVGCRATIDCPRFDQTCDIFTGTCRIRQNNAWISHN